jgi:hypothetical protein
MSTGGSHDLRQEVLEPGQGPDYLDPAPRETHGKNWLQGKPQSSGFGAATNMPVHIIFAVPRTTSLADLPRGNLPLESK